MLFYILEYILLHFHLLESWEDISVVNRVLLGQQQSSFVTLKDLREECKMNLEMLNAMPMEKH